MDEEVFDLSDAIDIIYGDACAYEIPMGNKEPTTDMFEVVDIGGEYLKLKHLFNDKEFYPVEIPIVIAKLLLVGDVFLMTLSKKNNLWGVSYMSHPYETVG